MMSMLKLKSLEGLAYSSGRVCTVNIGAQDNTFNDMPSWWLQEIWPCRGNWLIPNQNQNYDPKKLFKCSGIRKLQMYYNKHNFVKNTNKHLFEIHYLHQWPAFYVIFISCKYSWFRNLWLVFYFNQSSSCLRWPIP